MSGIYTFNRPISSKPSMQRQIIFLYLFQPRSPVVNPAPSATTPVTRIPRILLFNTLPDVYNLGPTSFSPIESRAAFSPTTPETFGSACLRETREINCEVVPVRPILSSPFNPTQLAMERLQFLVKAYRLGQVILWKKQMQNGFYIASIKIWGMEFCCFPQEFASSIDAYECAARKACHHFERIFRCG